MTSRDSAKPFEIFSNDASECARSAMHTYHEYASSSSSSLVSLTVVHCASSENLHQRPPKWVGHYVMGELIARGSFARVKEALDTDTLCRKAIKILNLRQLRSMNSDESAVETEIELLKTLYHKNVIRMVEVIRKQEKMKVYLVFDYCVASLLDLLDSVPGVKLPAWQAHGYFCQLVDGLGYLHKEGVIHKDIKPGNLLLTHSEILKICDFGVSESLDRLARNDICYVSRGTPSFQPPEVVNGAKKFSGFKLDIWSSGVTLFQLVTGTLPFEGKTLYLLHTNISKCVPLIPVYLEKSLRDLLRCLLRKDPHRRLSLNQIRKHKWIKRRPMTLPDGVPVNDPIRSVLSYVEALEVKERGTWVDERHFCDLKSLADEESFALLEKEGEGDSNGKMTPITTTMSEQGHLPRTRDEYGALSM